MPDAPIIERQRLRFKGNSLEFGTAITNEINSQTLQAWCGKAAQFEVAHYYGAAIAAISNFDFISLVIKSGNKAPAPTDAALAQCIVAAGAFDATCTDADWKAGTKQHFVFTLSDEEMAQAPGTYWLLLYGTTIAGNTVPLRAGLISFVEDGGPSESAPDPVTLGAWTKGESDARFAMLTKAGLTNKVTWDGTYTMVGSPGQYDLTAEYLVVYTGDGTTHSWLKINGSNA